MSERKSMHVKNAEQEPHLERESDAMPGSLKRPYAAPELRHFGSLRELTHTLSFVTPGDGFGASYAF